MSKIRNPNIEILNKPKRAKPEFKIPNGPFRIFFFLIIRICFQFRNSNLGFQCFETAPPTYRITLSALAKTLGGIVKPICFAAFRLMMTQTSSAARLGRSAGLVALQNLIDENGAASGRLSDRIGSVRTSSRRSQQNLPDNISSVSDFLSPTPRSDFG